MNHRSVFYTIKSIIAIRCVSREVSVALSNCQLPSLFWFRIKLVLYCESESVVAQLCPTDSLLTPWTVVYQASLSMGFSRQEYWSGLPFPSPGDLPDPGIEPRSSALQADALPSEPPGN